MRFNSLFGILSLSLIGASCNFHFKETPIENEPIQMKASDSGCLSRASSTFNRFFEGIATESEVENLWNCASRSLQLFSQRTRGNTSGLYKPKELRGFLEKYFLKEVKISDPLLREAMEIKCTLLGGSPDTLTLDELNQTLELIQLLKKHSLNLLPFAPLSTTWAITQSAQRLDLAVLTLEQAAQAIGKSLKKTGYPYHFSHLITLQEEIAKLKNSPHSRNILTILKDRINLFSSLKSLVLSHPSNQITGSEWEDFFTTATRAYGLWLRLNHLQSNYPTFFSGPGRERVTQLSLETLQLFSESIQRHDSLIRLTEIDSLLDSLYLEEIPAPSNVRKDELELYRTRLKAFLRPLFKRYLGGSDEFIHQTLVSNTAQKIRQWSEGQRYLEALYDELDRRNPQSKFEQEGYLKKDLLQLSLEQLFQKNEITSELQQSSDRLRKIIETVRPLFKPGSSEKPGSLEIWFLPFENHPIHSFYNLSQMNWISIISESILSGYTQDPYKAQNLQGMNLKEAYRFFGDIIDLGMSLKFFDPRKDNFKLVEPRFLEANLFTFQGNGDDLMSLGETIEFLSYSISGSSLKERTHQTVSKRAGHLGPDVFGNFLVEPSLYRQEFYSNAAEYWEHMPGMAEAYQQLSEKEKIEFQHSLEIAAKIDYQKNGNAFDTNDTLSLVSVLQYIEALFMRFDLDQSNKLSCDEADQAYPVFQNAIVKVIERKGLADQVKPEDYKSLFTYMLKFSDYPKTKKEKAYYYFIWRQKNCEISANRLTLIKLFAMLSKN